MEMFAALVKPAEGHFFLAYIDPGTGSMIIQVLLATLVGVALSLRHSWHALTRWFGRDRSAERGSEDTPEQID